jgi:hypothetical protein
MQPQKATIKSAKVNLIMQQQHHKIFKQLKKKSKQNKTLHCWNKKHS